MDFFITFLGSPKKEGESPGGRNRTQTFGCPHNPCNLGNTHTYPRRITTHTTNDTTSVVSRTSQERVAHNDDTGMWADAMVRANPFILSFIYIDD